MGTPSKKTVPAASAKVSEEPKEPAPTSSKKTVPVASPKSSSPEKKSSSTATTLAPVAPSSGAKDLIPREETTPSPSKKILSPAPASKLPSASKTPLSTLSKVIDDTIVIPKKRGRPSTVKTEPSMENIEKIEKVEVEVETYVNNESFLKK